MKNKLPPNPTPYIGSFSCTHNVFFLNLGWKYMAVLYLILLVFFSVDYFVMKKFSVIHQVVPVDFENLPHQQLLLPQETAYSCQG